MEKRRSYRRASKRAGSCPGRGCPTQCSTPCIHPPHTPHLSGAVKQLQSMCGTLWHIRQCSHVVNASEFPRSAGSTAAMHRPAPTACSRSGCLTLLIWCAQLRMHRWYLCCCWWPPDLGGLLVVPHSATLHMHLAHPVTLLAEVCTCDDISIPAKHITQTVNHLLLPLSNTLFDHIWLHHMITLAAAVAGSTTAQQDARVCSVWSKLLVECGPCIPQEWATY